MKNDPDELLPTRWTLIERLKNWDDQESWRQFFDTYWKLIQGFGDETCVAGDLKRCAVSFSVQSGSDT